jgi:NADH-quinone oxidoreductase subunit M
MSLVVGGLLALLAALIQQKWPRYVVLTILVLNLALVYSICQSPSDNLIWMREFKVNWIPSMGISFYLAADQFSLIMIGLTLFTGIVAIITTWKAINSKNGWFYFNLMFMLAGVVGIFLAIDLFLFYFFWEVMLIPLFLLMLSWGGENKEKAAYKFFIYTQGSGLLMLLSILALYFIHGHVTGSYTFDYTQLLGTTIAPKYATLILSGFLIAFCVKLPIFPVHGWLPGSFAETPISAILTGLLIKTGAYGLIRFALPLFPNASVLVSNSMMVLGAVSAIYGAILAYSQTDLRKIAAFSTISHMGILLIGIFSGNLLAWQGVVMLILISALSTGALLLVGYILYERTQTYNIEKIGGLWATIPNLSGLGVFFVMAMVGLPGLGNFIAEFLILAGAYKVSATITIVASISVVLSAVYMLRVIQKLFVGKLNSPAEIKDISLREKFVMAILMVVLIILGLFPQKIFNRSEPAMNKILQLSGGACFNDNVIKTVAKPNSAVNDTVKIISPVL